MSQAAGAGPSILARRTAATRLGCSASSQARAWLALAKDRRTAAGGEIVHWLADERFWASAEFIPFIAAGVFFYGLSQLALYGLVLVNQFKWAALWWLVGGGVSILHQRRDRVVP